MSSKLPKGHANTAVNCSTGDSKQSSVLVDSGASASSHQSTTTLHSGSINDMEQIPTRYILARAMPFYTRSGYDFSYRPLQHDIWCLVRTEEGELEYELLSDCQKKMKSGKVRYDDIDWGKGVHPNEDSEWVLRLQSRGQWSQNVYDVKAAVLFEKKNHVTVFLSAKKDKGKLLDEIRKECNYASDEFVRVPLSSFKPREKRLIYSCKKLRPKTSNRQDPRPSTQAA
ncbi:hypothetical protein T440DRAFT_523803 [Plenodomus tracheiphilus IPT5]|uniref:Uncharacterized protein n=1 Tax=Plenodomus tracheiphilus IPT5 TaxID=1408161 RepID=A0A6A7ANZ4_9PLEO|nr:hypothetical protein T440DRAFT_523803 [Plenodomus tracheiphilus IPT5]